MRFPLDPSVTVYSYSDSFRDLSHGEDRTPGIISRCLWCRKIKKQVAPDVSISFLPGPNLFNVFTRKNDKVIVSERADPLVMGIYNDLIEKYSLHHADHVIIQSAQVQAHFDSKIRQKSSIIMNPVSILCKASPKRVNKIVNIGRLVPQKDQRLLIDAFNEFHKTHTDYTLEIFGTGKLEDDLKNQISELGLGNEVILYGFVPDIHTKIADARFPVLSSAFEGLSNALLEAMMMGDRMHIH